MTREQAYETVARLAMTRGDETISTGDVIDLAIAVRYLFDTLMPEKRYPTCGHRDDRGAAVNLPADAFSGHDSGR